MINKKIYNALIELAEKHETICYSELASKCDIPYTSIDERNKFHHQLGEISEFEVLNKRPMLSVLVHHKDDPERNPGMGFFELADKLKQKKSGETKNVMKFRIIKECWKTKYNNI